MHGQAKCSDRFLWAIIKVCKILLRFFLAGFQYCLFKLELGWYSSFLLSLPELVIPLHKSPGVVAFIQHGLVTPWEATPSPVLELWYDSVQKWLNRLNSSSFPLSLLLTPTCMHTCVHALRQTHALGFLAKQKWERGTLQHSVLEGTLPMKWGPLSPVYRKGHNTLLPSNDLNSPATFHSPTLSSDTLQPYSTCPISSNTPCSFLPQTLLWWDHPSSFLFWWPLVHPLGLSLDGLPWWLRGKESICQCRRHGFDPWVVKIPWRRKWQPTPVFLPGKSMDRGAWWATVHGVAIVGHNLATKQQQVKLDGISLIPQGNDLDALVMCYYGELALSHLDCNLSPQTELQILRYRPRLSCSQTCTRVG